MKSYFYYEYGRPDVLQMQEVEMPVPASNEVLIKLRAVSLNASDWEFLTGTPAYARINGLRKPARIKTLGSDITGVVAAVGNKVTKFKPGDEVYGDVFDTMGGFAEYVCAPDNKLSFKPASMSFTEVAAIPQAGAIALQGIRDKGQVRAGQQVLINGAGGGSGSFAIQIAKQLGAEVTAVDNDEKLEFMRSLGADHVIDYREEDFTRNGTKYDLILDLAAYHSLFDYVRALKRGGRYFLVGGATPMLFKVLLLGVWLRLFTGKKLGMLALRNNQGLDDIIHMYEQGVLKPTIDREFSFAEIPQAIAYLGEGHAKGKVVITFS